MCSDPAFLFCVFCTFCTFNQNRASSYGRGTAARAACTPTDGAASPFAHLMLRDVPHAGLPSVLGLRAVTDARPLPDASSTGDGAGRPRRPGAPATVNCRGRAGDREAGMAPRWGLEGEKQVGWGLQRGRKVGKKALLRPETQRRGPRGNSAGCFHLWDQKSHHLHVQRLRAADRASGCRRTCHVHEALVPESSVFSGRHSPRVS